MAHLEQLQNGMRLHGKDFKVTLQWHTSPTSNYLTIESTDYDPITIWCGERLYNTLHDLLHVLEECEAGPRVVVVDKPQADEYECFYEFPNEMEAQAEVGLLRGVYKAPRFRIRILDVLRAREVTEPGYKWNEVPDNRTELGLP